ncbi:MFS transporter [Streptomyces sp. NBC_01762]|uniref:MFS transporter n=1 Tax=unclassified Streptomyces TaxID=2593676 RepID=UPI002DD954FE|nr:MULTISPECIES: MFS transporter [unclassified Streptomyces]WSC49572.1 MFS transporter [Streptomyces sp. NBC_01762]WSD29146.1 MFS transporter [Streptomyces sp. NBC_01751]
MSLHATTWEAAVLAAVQKTPPLLFSLPAGAWCDRVRKRPLMMATSLICAAAMASIPLAASYGRLTLIQLWVAAFAVGSCHVVGMAASLSYIPQLLPSHRLMEANAKLDSANTLADIGGPALAGALIGVIGAARAVAAAAVSYLVTAWCTLLIRSPETVPEQSTTQRKLRSEIRAGLAYTWRHPVIGPLVTTNAITSTVLAGTNAIWVVYLIRELHWSPQTFAVVMSIGASGGFLASLTTPRLTSRYGAGPVMITALTLAPVSQLPLLLADPGLPGQLGIGCGLFAQLFGAVTHGLTQRTVRQRACAPDMQGRMQATGQWTAFGLRPFAALLAGYTGTTLGLHTTLSLGACLLVLPPLRLALTPIRTLRLAAP